MISLAGQNASGELEYRALPLATAARHDLGSSDLLPYAMRGAHSGMKNCSIVSLHAGRYSFYPIVESNLSGKD
jgi:hypothetical protein